MMGEEHHPTLSNLSLTPDTPTPYCSNDDDDDEEEATIVERHRDTPTPSHYPTPIVTSPKRQREEEEDGQVSRVEESKIKKVKGNDGSSRKIIVVEDSESELSVSRYLFHSSSQSIISFWSRKQTLIRLRSMMHQDNFDTPPPEITFIHHNSSHTVPRPLNWLQAEFEVRKFFKIPKVAEIELEIIFCGRNNVMSERGWIGVRARDRVHVNTINKSDDDYFGVVVRCMSSFSSCASYKRKSDPISFAIFFLANVEPQHMRYQVRPSTTISHLKALIELETNIARSSFALFFNKLPLDFQRRISEYNIVAPVGPDDPCAVITMFSREIAGIKQKS